MQNKGTRIYNVIHASVKNKELLWADLVTNINASDLKIKNFLQVRNVLAFCIDRGEFVRTANLHKEIYTFVKRTVND